MTRRRRRVRIGRLALPVYVVAALGSACDQVGDVPSPVGSGAGATTTAGVVRPVPMPDLSRLPDAVQDQVRERYAVLERLAREKPPPGELGRAHGEVGLILMAAEYETRALESLANAQVLAPDDPRWPYYLGQLRLLRGEHTEAQAAFERVRALRPTDLPTLVRLGETHLDRGRPGDADRLFREALALAPRSAAVLGGVGRAALAQQNHARAVQYLGQALSIEPQATSLHYPLALAYRGLGDLARADAHLRQRGGGDPTLADPLMEEYDGLLKSALAYQLRGVKALGSGKWEQAAALFRKGLELEPQNAALALQVGTALHLMGDVDAAIDQFEAIVQSSPEYAGAHFSLGVIYLTRGRYADAYARFAAAVEQDPDYVEAHLRLADTLRVMRRPAESLSHYDSVIEIDPRRVDAWIEGANVLVGLERYAEARDWLEAAGKAHPDLTEIASLRESVEGILELQRALR